MEHPPMMVGAVKVEFPFLRSYRTQHGKLVIYYRRNGRNKRLHTAPGTAEFQREYDEAVAALGISVPKPARIGAKPQARTVRWLVVEYLGSHHFRQLDAATTQRQRTRVVERLCQEPIKPGSPLTVADMPIARFDADAVRALRDRHDDRPEAARHLLKTISQMFDWAIKECPAAGITINPVLGVKRPRPKATGGHHTWSPAEVEKYEARHPIGTKARLALAILLYTGLRLSDAVRVGPANVSDGWLTVSVHKNRGRSPMILQLPVLPELQAIMDATELGASTFLVTDHGKPFASEKSFGNKVRDWCDQAGLAHCSAHGVRKAAATIIAERGATVDQLKAIFGWRKNSQAEVYVAAANRKRLAADAMPLLSGRKATASGT
jgi:integrase